MILRGDFFSSALRTATNIQVLIPDNFKEEGPYKIVYLLHGLHGNQGTWFDNTMLPYYAKNHNAVFVCPEAGRSFYADLKYGQNFFAYVGGELPQVCKKVFNISAKREDTAVMGCSMGGYGALKLALTYPERYGFCGAIAPACLFIKEILSNIRKDPKPMIEGGEDMRAIFMDLRTIYGDDLTLREENDIIDLLGKFSQPQFSAGREKPKIYMACGTEDDLRKENLLFKDVLRTSGFDHTSEEWSGGHEWYFFNEALKKALELWHS
jgi:S-formylglutathione hydrolase FrmB